MGGTNPTAPYTKLDNTSMLGTTYKNNIDNNSVAALRIVGAFLPHAQSSPNMTIAVDAGHLFNGTTLTEVAAQNTATITAPSVHPRIDRVVINSAGTVAVVTGTEAVSPVPPAIPNGRSPIAQIALTTSTTSITNAVITDERDFSALNVGGFGAQTSISSASTCDIGTLPSHNAKITGSTTITSFGSTATTSQPVYLVEFTGNLTISYNATSMILPGGADITTAAGDTGIAEYLGSGNWKIRSYDVAAGPSTRFIVNEQWFAAGSWTYTPTAGAKVADFDLVAAGAGGGGGEGSSSVGSDGTDASDTTMAGYTLSLTAGGGKKGTGAKTSPDRDGIPGAMGTASGGDINLVGGGSVGGVGGNGANINFGTGAPGGPGARCIKRGVDVSSGGTAAINVGGSGSGGAHGTGGSPAATNGITGADGYVKVTEWSA